MSADPRQAVLAALDADDQRARAAIPWPHVPTDQWIAKPWAAHVAAHDPESTLRRNAGVRAVVEMHTLYVLDQRSCAACQYPMWCPTIRALADAYCPDWSSPAAADSSVAAGGSRD